MVGVSFTGVTTSLYILFLSYEAQAYQPSYLKDTTFCTNFLLLFDVNVGAWNLFLFACFMVFKCRYYGYD